MLEHVSEFKYFGCVLDESGTDEAECCRKVASRRRAAGAIRYIVNDRCGLRPFMSHCSCLFLSMVRRQRYGRRGRGLGLELCRWTTSRFAGYQKNG